MNQDRCKMSGRKVSIDKAAEQECRSTASMTCPGCERKIIVSRWSSLDHTAVLSPHA